MLFSSSLCLNTNNYVDKKPGAELTATVMNYLSQRTPTVLISNLQPLQDVYSVILILSKFKNVFLIDFLFEQTNVPELQSEGHRFEPQSQIHPADGHRVC